MRMAYSVSANALRHPASRMRPARRSRNNDDEARRTGEQVMKTGIVGTLARAARIAALPLAAAALPAIAHAQGSQELFEWRGSVDQEVRIQMRGGQTSVMGMGPREMTAYDQVRRMSGVPAAPGYVTVQMLQGRGTADVVQQPSAQNGYTTVVRVRDMQSGASTYDIAAYWQPTGNSGYNNGRYGRYGATNGTYGGYGKPYPGGGAQQPVYRNGYPVNQGGYPVYQGGKQLPGTQQGNAPVYGSYPYPAGQRVNPNGKVLPNGAQQAHSHKHDRNRKHRDQDDRDDQE